MFVHREPQQSALLFINPQFHPKMSFSNSSIFVDFLLHFFFFFLIKMNATFFFNHSAYPQKEISSALIVFSICQWLYYQTVHADMLASNIQVSNSVKSFHKRCRLIVRIKKTKQKSFCCFMVLLITLKKTQKNETV